MLSSKNNELSQPYQSVAIDVKLTAKGRNWEAPVSAGADWPSDNPRNG